MEGYAREKFEVGLLLWQRWERHVSAVGLAFGFALDLIIADSPDSVANNLLLLSYLVIAGTLIIVFNIRVARRVVEGHLVQPLFLLFFLQVCFGGLASNLLVLYGRSGTFAGSALFLGLLGAMLVGNEFLKTRYAHLRFNVAVYYLLLFSYLLIALPVFFFHSIGPLVFLASGFVSLVLIALFLTILYVVVFRQQEKQRITEVSAIVGAIFIVFNVLYFVNVIPPVPLVLKDIGVYHSLLRDSESRYLATYESPAWFEFWRSTSATYTLTSSRNAFCFSSVFAPTDLETPIFHRWERYDATAGAWETKLRVSFPIAGGRSAGYRGFSVTSELEPGRSRCTVETAQGALIGRITFETVKSMVPPVLLTKTL